MKLKDKNKILKNNGYYRRMGDKEKFDILYPGYDRKRL